MRLTAEQKTRLILTGSPFGEPIFPHEGEAVVRWLTGGTQLDAYVTFQQREEVIVARCPLCGAEIGSFAADYGGKAYAQIEHIRATAVAHQQELHRS